MSAVVKQWKSISGWIALLLLWTTVPEVLGADASGGWRPTYDIAMRWFNFGILIVLFFKYARKPLVDFLRGKARQIEENIKEFEAEKDAIKTRVNDLLKEREENQKRLQKIKDRIVSHGKLKKEKIIEDARIESQLLLESAKRRMAHEINAARHKLRDEIVDQAIDLAMKKLPQRMTDQDTQQTLQSYLDNIQTLPKS